MNTRLFLILAALPLAAQVRPSELMPLSLNQAVDLALAPTGALRLQMAGELTRQSEAQRAQARAALLPHVEGCYTFRSFTNNLEAFGLQLNRPGLPFAIPAFVGPIDTFDTRATAAWAVFDLSAWKRYQASGARLKAVTLEQQAQRNQTIAAAVRAYTSAQRARQMVATAQANVELAQRLERLAQSQKNAGTATGIDITRAQVQVSAERQNLVAAEQEKVSADLQLLRAMNLTLATELEITDPLEYRPIDRPTPAQAIETAQRERPELKAQAERRRASQLGYEAAKWQRLPSIQAFGDYGVIGTSPATGLPTRAVGARLTIPIFDGGRTDALRAESASLLRQESLRGRDIEQQVELEVRLSLEALRTAERQVLTASETLTLAEKELEHAQRRYASGVAPNLEVTDAQTRVARAREQRVNAVYRFRSARVELGVATGAIEQVFQN